MCGFSTRLIENGVFAIFTRYDNFACTDRFNFNSLFIFCVIRWRNVMKLIKNCDNQMWRVKGLQMRYNLSKFDNDNEVGCILGGPLIWNELDKAWQGRLPQQRLTLTFHHYFQQTEIAYQIFKLSWKPVWNPWIEWTNISCVKET